MMRRNISLVKDPNLFTAKKNLMKPKIITSFKERHLTMSQSTSSEDKPDTHEI